MKDTIKLVPVITNPNFGNLLESYSIYELRLDYWPQLNIAKIAKCMLDIDRPCILTLRARSAGGRFQGSEKERIAWLKKLILLNPAYLDLEDSIDNDVISQLHDLNPAVRLIRSFHDFNSTPSDLSAILQSLHHPAISLYKIATMAHSTLDALRLLQWLQQQQNVIGLCMGEYGSCTRILAPVVGSPWTYVPHGEEMAAPGMLSAEILQNIYRHAELNRHTRILGLIGDPVEQSDGHRFHNDYYRQHNINAVYVKWRVRDNELAEFFQLIKSLPVEGLSVTMPLKERVLAYVDELDEIATAVAAVNTLTLNNGAVFATNTDVAGVLVPLTQQSNLMGKQALIIGAGGAAKAVAYALTAAGANIAVINRTSAKAQQLAARFSGRVAAFNSDEYFDIVINTLPDKPETTDFIQSTVLQSITTHTIAMDIVYKPKETTFILLAKQRTANIIYGESMFLAQAKEQASIFHKHCSQNG